MARPIKKGLDYFPVDTTILSDLKVRRIKRKYGAKSFLLYMALLCDIYANSFYICADDDYLFDLSEQLKMSESEVLEMLLAMVKIGLFDPELFQNRRILTSTSIQRRFFSIKLRRLDMFDSEEVEYLLVKIDFSKPPVMRSITPKKEALSTQSKVKERKVKKTHSLCSFVSRERESECESEQEKWQIWKNELLADEDRQASAIRQSGEGVEFDALQPAKPDELFYHLLRREKKCRDEKRASGGRQSFGYGAVRTPEPLGWYAPDG